MDCLLKKDDKILIPAAYLNENCPSFYTIVDAVKLRKNIRLKCMSLKDGIRLIIDISKGHSFLCLKSEKQFIKINE